MDEHFLGVLSVCANTLNWVRVEGGSGGVQGGSAVSDVSDKVKMQLLSFFRCFQGGLDWDTTAEGCLSPPVPPI